MPRDFDAGLERDRVFKVGGDSFTYRIVHWREFAQLIDDESARELAAQAEQKQIAEAEGEEAAELLEATMVADMERVLSRVCQYLVPEDVERFKAFATNEEKPFSWGQLLELRDWLGEVQTARPTKQPGTSSRGRGGTGAT